MIRKPALFILAALFTAGCGDPLTMHPQATTLPAGPIRLSDAQPLDDLASDDVQVNLTDKLDPPQASDTVYFGEADVYDSDQPDAPVAAAPLLAIHDGDTWKAVAVSGPGLTDAGWKYVGAGPARHEIWGVLDTSAGESRSEFVVAHSTDGASTFTTRVFKKPCRLATVDDFAMSRDGRGRVTLSLDTDCGASKAGLYHYETTDDGKTWSANPRFEPDAMIRSDTVPDDEQPDQAQPAAKTIYHRKGALRASAIASLRAAKSPTFKNR